MATTMPVLPGGKSPSGLPGGGVTGLANTGLPVIGNAAGNNQFSPMGGTTPASSPGGPNSTLPGGVHGQTAYTSGGTSTVAPLAGTATAPTTPAPAPASAASAATAGDTTTQTNDITKQLNDTYGKGEGTLINNLINNIGSGDSTYIQAYQQAIANPNAEGLATLQTQLGNAGISANSSAAAIEQADYQSNTVAQEGLQEQQLQQQGLQDTVGLVSGLEGATNTEATTGGVLQDIGGVLSGVAGAAGGILTGGAAVAKAGGLSSVF